MFKNSDGRLIFALIFFFGQSSFGLIMITQTLFTDARYAGIATSIIYFGLSLMNNPVNQAGTPEWIVAAVSLVSPAVAMIHASRNAVHFESGGVGFSTENWE